MADDDVENDSGADNEAAEKKKGGGSMLGALAGLGAAMALGIGIGMLLLNMISGPEEKTTDEDSEEEGKEVVEQSTSAKNLLETTSEIIFTEVIANLKGKVGVYVKVTVSIWVDTGDVFTKVSDPRVHKLLQEQLIEELRSYSKQELENDFVLDQIRKGFHDRMDRVLRDVFGAGPETEYVRKLIMSDIILQ